MVQALESYSSHLEPSFVRIKLPSTDHDPDLQTDLDLTPAYISSVDNELTRVYEEYTRRVNIVRGNAEKIVTLWAELGFPQAQTESNIVKHYRDSPEQLGLRMDDLENLQTKRDRLLEEKRSRERQIKDFKAAIEVLWDRLGEDEARRKDFLVGIRGCGMRVINNMEAELDRLHELKRQNLHLFVEDARYRLQELWDELFLSEEEMLEFTPAFSDVYSDALLSAHEAEIARLESLREQRAPTLELINKHRSLIKDRTDLSAAAQDGSRLLAKSNKGEKRDPTRLLREEKMRKRIAKDLPKVELELEKTLSRWEGEFARPFLVHGKRYLDELRAGATAKASGSRPKTPAGSSVAATTKKVPLKIESDSRAGSVMRNHTSIKSIRAGTATPATRTSQYDSLASSVCTTGGRTPSRIPARIPLGNMQHGGNSPQRRNVHQLSPKTKYDAQNVRKMAPSARPLPPNMPELLDEPSAAFPVICGREHERPASINNSIGSVRPVNTKDSNDASERMSYANPPMALELFSTGTHANTHDFVDTKYYNSEAKWCIDHPVDIRQISTASTASVSGTAVSGSENWETYDDASEIEAGAEVVRTGSRTIQHVIGKRFAPEGGHTSRVAGPGKKFKVMYGYSGATDGPGQMIDHNARVGSGSRSEGAWTDEEAF